MAKCRITNFKIEEEPIILLESPTKQGCRDARRAKSVGQKRAMKAATNAIALEADKMKARFEVDVQSPIKKYIKNVTGVTDNNKKIFGERMEKYKDVLKYDEVVFHDQANMENLGEAYKVVDLIYKKRIPIQGGAGMRKVQDLFDKKRFTQYDLNQQGIVIERADTTVDESKSYISLESKEEDYSDDKVFQAKRKEIPTSGLVCKKNVNRFDENQDSQISLLTSGKTKSGYIGSSSSSPLWNKIRSRALTSFPQKHDLSKRESIKMLLS